MCRIRLPNEVGFLSVERTPVPVRTLTLNGFDGVVLDHQRDAHLPGHHEVLPQPASGLQPRERLTSLQTDGVSTQSFMNSARCVQVYRSVLLRRSPRLQPADENMEVDSASGGECKLRHTWL